MPLSNDLEAWLRVRARRLSRKSGRGKAGAHILINQEGVTRVAGEGRVEMDSNLVENRIRPLTLDRKNALFAGHDAGASGWPGSPRSPPPAG